MMEFSSGTSMAQFIDVHQHILPDVYVEAVSAEAIGKQGSSGRLPRWSVEDALRQMDTSGIATAITSISSPGLLVQDATVAVPLARACNDFAAELTVRHSGRFGMFTTVPLTDIDSALVEVRYGYEQARADGICLLSNFNGKYLGDPHYWPLYEELDRRNAVVFVHPTSAQHRVDIEGLSASSMEFTFDTARALASLIFSGCLHRFPGIRFIFSHMGGAFPYIAERIGVLTRNNPRLQTFIPNGISAELAKVYFDTALSANAVTFAAMAEIAGLNNVLFGTDYPFGPPQPMTSAVDSLRATLLQRGDAADNLHRIARGSAETLFPRFRRQTA